MKEKLEKIPEALKETTKIEKKTPEISLEVKEFYKKYSPQIREDYQSIEEARSAYYKILDNIGAMLEGTTNEEETRRFIEKHLKPAASQALEKWIASEQNFSKKYRPEVKEFSLKEKDKLEKKGKSEQQITEEKRVKKENLKRYQQLETDFDISDPFFEGKELGSPEDLEEIPELEGYLPEEEEK